MGGFATETLLSLLGCLNVGEEEFGASLNNKIFKTANAELFRKIVCFILSKYGDFDRFVETYRSSHSLSPKTEAQFRSSLKDIVSTVNGFYPDKYNLKPINQSYLIAPQGQKIVDFLVRLVNVTLLITYERSGVSYVPPQTVEECNSFLTENQLLENVDEQTAEIQIKQKRLESNALKTECLSHSWQLSLPPDLENKLDIEMDRSDPDESTIEALTQISHVLADRLDCTQLGVRYFKLLLNSLNSFKDNYRELKHKPKNLSLDGSVILNELGFESNVSATVDNVELIVNGKLDLNSLFELASSKCKMLSEYVDRKGNETIRDLDSYLNEKLSLECVSYLDEEQTLRKLIDKIKPVISVKRVQVKELLQRSEDPFHVTIREYLDFGNSFVSKQELLKDRAPIQIALPVADEDLVEWILENETDTSKSDPLNKTGKLCSKQVNYLSLSTKKLSNFKSEKKKFHVEEKNKLLTIKTALFNGLGNRRVTLGSPSARRERFKVKHFDDKRKPLKPMTSKALFCASSPINTSSPTHNIEPDKQVFIESTFNIEEFAGSTSSTVNRSLLKTDEELNNSITSLAFGCGFNLNRTLSEPSLNLTQELLKFEKSLSDSDLDSPVTPLKSLKADTDSPQLNKSIEQLIFQFKSYKDKLNLSE